MPTLRRTKIVCTIGPATDAPEVLSALIDAGMNVARLNFSHGTREEHRQRLQWIREIAGKKNLPVAILQDLSGPKLRTGPMAKPVVLHSGDIFVLTSRQVPGDEQAVSVTWIDLPTHVQIGENILLADGTIQLQVIDKNATDLQCRVLDGGMLSSNKGINLPQTSLAIPALTEKDKNDLEFGLESGVDCVALSFVRKPEDIRLVKEVMAAKGRTVPVIAKIEKHEALERIDGIIDIADGIMIARGDLAVETPLERVPLVQKMLIKKCNRVGKPVITATQMLKSMVDDPRPTRAETTDIANAVLDGTDAVMLSEETAMGKFPVEAVTVMDKVLRTTEAELSPRDRLPAERHHDEITVEAAVSHAVVTMARELKVAAILTPTRSGSTARLVSRYRPHVPIIAMSYRLETVRWLALVWGVHPLYHPEPHANSDDLIAHCKREALATGLVKRGDTVLITAGLPPGEHSTTNLIKVEVLV
ncbi:MAG: pyruvate kinase [candidate division KSB1 bacterium]|nr:pyruvate kinase [candidate division KSB1 bacterium]MDZ7304088.1 pyruvate kinase [candidate division KSB1 bacterium]MDZ7312068.1 pyruvate kinase [candidate division KSB1 bacterium]